MPTMDLEEKTLEKVGRPLRGVRRELTDRELEQVIESGGPALGAIHAAEVVPVGEDADDQDA